MDLRQSVGFTAILGYLRLYPCGKGIFSVLLSNTDEIKATGNI